MTSTVNHATVVRRIGVLVFMGVALALIGIGTSGNAAADTAHPWLPDVPFDPGIPLPSAAAPPTWEPTSAPPQTQDSYLPSAPLPAPPTPAFGDSVSLNPQPIPPGPERGRRVSLNPQPLPPGPDRWRDSLTLLPGF
jgi:hypothetical protein